jgi:2-polyprenyl-3-methyl-5-hydroxy-6-metoxy-1,4-benzoquinol methylase
MRKELHQANRLSWNAATAAHNSHKGDQAAFLRAGGGTLFPEEVELLGDVAGRSLAHLQCNAGQDTLSLARLGANATGVDISDEAIGFARRLSDESGIPAAFERADVFDWMDAAVRHGRRYDVVFTSYGALVWLSDLGTWAKGVAGVLRPGGRLVVMEFHPVASMFDESLRLAWPYSTAGRTLEVPEGVGDYVAFSREGLVRTEYMEGVKDFANPHPSFEFMWGIGEVVQAVVDAGLRMETLREYPYSNGWAPYHGMRADLESRRFFPPEGVPSIPLMYGLTATRTAE